MAIMFTEHTSQFLRGDESHSEQLDERVVVEYAAVPFSEVMERVTEILGYDIFEASLIAEGIHEFGNEMLEISETTLFAGLEALPPASSDD